MADPIRPDNTINFAKDALNGLAVRQELIAQNLANVDTPGYRAQGVNFETVLKRAADAPLIKPLQTRSGHMASLVSSSSVRIAPRRGGTLRADGNNVDIDLELTDLTKTGVNFQALSQIVSKKLLLLKSIASGR
jgi:flagellar basal-body rod protein FlgB